MHWEHAKIRYLPGQNDIGMQQSVILVKCPVPMVKERNVHPPGETLMKKRRIVIFSAIASLAVAGGAALMYGMQAVAGHRQGGYGGPIGLVCNGNSDAKFTKITDKATNWLDLTDEQQQNLSTVVQVVQKSNLEEFCPSGDRTQRDTPAKLAKLEQMMTRGLQTVQEVQPPFTTFYESLSSEQQTKLDTMFARRSRAHKQRADRSR